MKIFESPGQDLWDPMLGNQVGRTNQYIHTHVCTTMYVCTVLSKEELEQHTHTHSSSPPCFFPSVVIYCDRLMANIDFALRTLAAGWIFGEMLHRKKPPSTSVEINATQWETKQIRLMLKPHFVWLFFHNTVTV